MVVNVLRHLNKRDRAKISDFISVSLCTIAYIIFILTISTEQNFIFKPCYGLYYVIEDIFKDDVT